MFSRVVFPRFLAIGLLAVSLAGCINLSSKPAELLPVKPIIALPLGGGAAKGFAHIRVIMALDGQGIVPGTICLL